MNKFFKDSIVLCVITLIAGLLLGAVYEITYDAREEQKEASRIKAYKTVYADANDFKELDIDVAIFKETLKEQGITEKNVVIDNVIEALSSTNEVLGYIVNVTAKEGFSGDISFAVGIDKELKVKGVSMLSISETPGLGMNAANSEFLDRYVVDRDGMFIVNKLSDVEGTNIDAISGATITSNAVTKGVNTAVIVATALANGILENETIKEAE